MPDQEVTHEPKGAWLTCRKHKWDRRLDNRVQRPNGEVVVYRHCRTCPVGTLVREAS